MKKDIGKSRKNAPKVYNPTQPLWKIFPVKDDEGNNLTDFMMIMPGFKFLSRDLIIIKVKQIKILLERYKNTVVFAEINLEKNFLMVSVKPVPGICVELPMLIHSKVPEAKLVSAEMGCYK